MPDPHMLTLSSLSPDHSRQMACALAPHLRPGDTILLSGNVGAGKTHFARAMIQASLATPEDVPSPTYTLVQTYPCQWGEIWHADLYRLTSTQEIEELGLLQAFEDAICLVEWPDRLDDLAPSQTLSITLVPGDQDDTRQLDLRWNDPRWGDILKGLTDA